MPKLLRESGPQYAALGNEISDAIFRAISAGMGIDDAVCIVAAVAADYARGEYGDEYLKSLAQVVTKQAGQPMPGEVRH
jgi:hypothetical protein